MSAGQSIARARAAAGMSLEQLSDATKMRASIIAAMEADDFSLCGGPIYARGQLRMMAPILGLDPQALVEEFDQTSQGLDY